MKLFSPSLQMYSQQLFPHWIRILLMEYTQEKLDPFLWKCQHMMWLIRAATTVWEAEFPQKAELYIKKNKYPDAICLKCSFHSKNTSLCVVSGVILFDSFTLIYGEKFQLKFTMAISHKLSTKIGSKVLTSKCAKYSNRCWFSFITNSIEHIIQLIVLKLNSLQSNTHTHIYSILCWKSLIFFMVFCQLKHNFFFKLMGTTFHYPLNKYWQRGLEVSLCVQSAFWIHQQTHWKQMIRNANISVFAVCHSYAHCSQTCPHRKSHTFSMCRFFSTLSIPRYFQL